MQKIITDSAANLFAPALTGIKHQSVALSLLGQHAAFLDEAGFSQTAFAEFIAGQTGPIKTSCPNVDSYLAAMQGADEVYVFTISSALSGSYNAAQTAKQMLLEEDGGKKIAVFDTKAAGPTERMAAIKASQLIAAGLAFEEVVATVQAYIDRAKIFFGLQSVTNLANNGRINKTVAKLAQVLKINVLGWANEAGEIEQLGKARGAKKARHNLLALLEQHHFDGQHLVIDHADNLEGAKAFKDLVLAKYPTCQVEIGNCNALCSFYAEKGGLMIGCLVKE